MWHWCFLIFFCIYPYLCIRMPFLQLFCPFFVSLVDILAKEFLDNVLFFFPINRFLFVLFLLLEWFFNVLFKNTVIFLKPLFLVIPQFFTLNDIFFFNTYSLSRTRRCSQALCHVLGSRIIEGQMRNGKEPDCVYPFIPFFMSFYI